MKILLIRQKKNKPTVKGTFSDKILSPIICSLVNFYIINKKKKEILILLFFPVLKELNHVLFFFCWAVFTYSKRTKCF